MGRDALLGRGWARRYGYEGIRGEGRLVQGKMLTCLYVGEMHCFGRQDKGEAVESRASLCLG